MLGSFEVQRFRTFKQLRIERLGRVNLVVGRNNVGKTMLLEALRLYVNGAQIESLAHLLLEREELSPPMSPATIRGPATLRIDSLLHARDLTVPRANEIRLFDPTSPSHALCIEVASLDQTLSVSRNGQGGFNCPWNNLLNGLTKKGSARDFDKPAFLAAGGMSASQVGSTWDAMALKSGEDRVIQCLQTIAPVERVTLVQNPMRREERIVMVRVADRTEPVSLKSLGDGMTRVFQLALALEVAGSKPERAPLHPLLQAAQVIDEPMLLIDEVETGIHYSALPDVWRFLLRAARENDVQIFATTHSWDCIEAFQQAAADEPQGSAMLIRLERKEEEHRAVLFDQTELPVVTKHHIEVR